MAGVGHFHDDGVNHRQVQGSRHPVVQEGRVEHLAVGIEAVFLVERPADALHGAALYLAFHIAGMNGLAAVLHGGKAQQVNLARFRVNFHVGDIDGESVAHAGRVGGGPPHDGAAGAVETPRQLLKGHPQGVVGLVRQGAVGPVLHIRHRNIPDAGGAFQHLAAHVLAGLIHGGAHLEGDAAAAGAAAVADAVGVHNGRLDALGGQPQRFGQVHGHSGAGTADVRRTLNQADGAVGHHAGHGAGRAGAVEPGAGGNAPSGHPAGRRGGRQRSRQVRMLLRGLQNLHHSDAPESGAANLPAALLRGVPQPELYRVQAQLFAQFVNGLLRREGRRRRAGRAVGGRLGHIGDHIVALNEPVGHVVGREHCAAAAGDGRAGKGAGFVNQRGLRRREPAVARPAHFHLDLAAGSGAGAGEHFGAAHGDFDRAAGLAGQGGGHGLQIAAALPLAAEPAADFHRHDVHLPHRHAQDAAGVVPQGEMALAAGPDGDGVVVVPAGGGRVGFNVALMHLAGVVFPFYDGVGCGEARFRVAQGELEMVGNIGAVARFAFGPAAGTPRRAGQGNQPLVDDGRAGGHGGRGGQRRRQNFVVNVNQRQRFLGQVGRIGGDGGDGVAAVEGLFPRHHIAAVKAVVDGGAFLLVFDFGGHGGEIGAGDHGVDARPGQSAAGVNAPDAGVGVGAAQDFAVQHPRQMDVGGVTGAAHHLVRAVVAHRAGADHAVSFIGVGKNDVGLVIGHQRPPPVKVAGRLSCRRCHRAPGAKRRGLIYHNPRIPQ